VNPYGDGRAAERIRAILLQELRPETHNQNAGASLYGAGA